MVSLHWLDYAICVILFAVSLSIGVYHGCTGGRQNTTAEFLLANRKLRVIPTFISMMVSFQSAIMVLGYVAEMYTYGLTYWPSKIIGASFGIYLIERLFVPWFYPLKLTSVYEVIIGFIYNYTIIMIFTSIFLSISCISIISHDVLQI